MAKHAYLAASASERWLHCPPSAKLCAQEEDPGSPYAQQGTDAHELCQYLLEKALHGDVALVEAWRADRWGNLTYRKSARNFGPIMCMAAKTTIVQVRAKVALGELSPEAARELERNGRSITVVAGDAFVSALLASGVGVVTAAAPVRYVDDQLLGELLAG